MCYNDNQVNLTLGRKIDEQEKSGDYRRRTFGLDQRIYLQKNGYETEILEKNAVSGGACIGWERKGCYIDGCIHWLTGISPKASYHELWKEIHAVKEDTEIFFQDEFSRFDFGDGTKIIFWTDIEKTRKEWLAFAPEDKKEIERFLKMVKRFQEIEGPVKKPVDLMHLGDLLKIAFTMCGDYYWVNKTSKFSCPEYASRFQNKYLRAFLAHHMHGDDNMYFWWKKAKDEGRYKDEKKKLGKTLLALAERYYPQLTGKLEVIDVVTPCTYERYLNSRHGSFQGFVHTSKGKALMERGVVKGIDNFFLSGQCIFQSGGLPPAAFTGRFAAQRICKADKKKFIY